VVDAASVLASTGSSSTFAFGFGAGALLLGAFLVIRRRHTS
jgi:LPXTG-motif cell wall-anchored protein